MSNVSEQSAPGVLEQIGYLCIQRYPTRICPGCTSACCEPVFAYPAYPVEQTQSGSKESKT